jgi:hypothetical protein
MNDNSIHFLTATENRIKQKKKVYTLETLTIELSLYLYLEAVRANQAMFEI